MLKWLNHKNQKLLLSLPEATLMAHVDRIRIMQIVVNYLSNAIKYTPHEGRIQMALELHGDEAWISVSDNGIGMNAEEIKKYINQIAFSGATEFVEKYKGEGGEEKNIIGHFGLGFYSAFMVSEKVEIITKA